MLPSEHLAYTLVQLFKFLHICQRLCRLIIFLSSVRLRIVDFLENGVGHFGLAAVFVDRFKWFDISFLIFPLGRLSALWLVIIVNYEDLVVIAAASLAQTIVSKRSYGIRVWRWLLLPKLLLLNVLVEGFRQFDLTALLIICEDLLLPLSLHHSLHLFFWQISTLFWLMVSLWVIVCRKKKVLRFLFGLQNSIIHIRIVLRFLLVLIHQKL